MKEQLKVIRTINYINRHSLCEKYSNKLNIVLEKYKDVELISRVKNKKSALRKMKIRRYTQANEISDYLGYMIITENINEIYKIKNDIEKVLGNGLEEDYIKNPKFGYKSFHLNYTVENGIPLEIQIKTRRLKFAQDIVHDKISKHFYLPEDERNRLSQLAYGILQQ